jgi:hypothetical protein
MRSYHADGVKLLEDNIDTIKKKIKKNSMVWVRKRAIPNERPPPVGEVIANFCGWGVPRGQRDGSYGRILGFLYRSRYFSIK